MRILPISQQKEKLFLVFDQGGHATRALVFDCAANVVCRVDVEISTITDGELIVEHDPEEMIQSIFQVLDEVHDLLGERFSQITSAGLATQRSSIVCWNKVTGRALTPIISWQDRRAMSEVTRYESAKTLIHKKTGLYLNPHYGATKINWCLSRNALVQEALSAGELCVGPLASFILFHLLKGQPFKVDPANASRTLLMDYKTRCWDEFLAELFQIPLSLLPKIENTRAEYGRLNYKSCDIPLNLCTGDQSAAIFIAGNPAPKRLYVNMGTGAFVQQYSEQIPDLAKEKMLASIVYSDQNTCAYVIEGTVNGAGRALEWLAEKLGVENYRSYLDSWGQCYENPPIFINGISGLGSPFWRSRVTTRFLSEASNEEKFVGVLESIVFLIYANIEKIKNIGVLPDRIDISGGLSKSYLICQKLSDLSQMVVFRTLEVEATALGVCFLLTGAYQKEGAAECQRFFPTKNKSLHARYARWLEVTAHE